MATSDDFDDVCPLCGDEIRAPNLPMHIVENHSDGGDVDAGV